MKINSYLAVFLTFFLSIISVSVSAKPEKIKYGKYLIYQGEVDEGEPFQHGVLSCLNPEDKDHEVLRIEGDFSRHYITNATITSNGIHDFGFNGNLSFLIDAEDKDNVVLSLVLGNTRRSKLSHDYIMVSGVMLPYIMVKDLAMTVTFDKKTKKWNFTYGDEKAAATHHIAVIEGMDFPDIIEKFKYTTRELRGVKCTLSIGQDSIVSTDKSCTYIFDDGTTFCGNELTFGTGGTFYVNKNSWYGTHKFVDGTSINRPNPENFFKIQYANGDVYEGSVTCDDFADAFGRNATKHSFTYYDGVFRSGRDTEKWIMGETFTQRHERLIRKYDADLVDSLENELLTLKQCDSAMTSRADIKRKLEEERLYKEELANNANYGEILMNHWNVTESVFLEGSIKTWNMENFQSASDIDPKCLSGYLALTLESNRNAMLVVQVTPTKEAFKQGADYTAKVQNFCAMVSKQVTGKWSVDGNKILFDGKDVGLQFDADGSTVKYDNVIAGTVATNKPAAKTTSKSSAKKKKK